MSAKLREFPDKELWERPAPPLHPGASKALRFQNVSVTYFNADVGSMPRMATSIRTVGMQASKLPVIEMFGLASSDIREDENGGFVQHGSYPLCVRIHGFLPYFYTRITDEALLAAFSTNGPNDPKCRAACSSVASLLGKHCPVVSVEAAYHKDIMGWMEDRTWFWKITLALPNDLAALRNQIHRSPGESGGILNAPEFGSCRTTYESNVPFAIRFMDDYNVPGMGWMDLPAGSYTVTPPERKTTYTHLEVDVHCKDIRPLAFHHNENAALRVMSMDIECMGRGRSFPVAEQDPIGCICVKNWEKQPDGAWKQLRGAAFTWKKPKPRTEQQMKDDLIVVAANEYEMLYYFVKFIRLFDPDILTGHNSNNFDWKYIWARANALQIERYDVDWDNFFNLGRKKGRAGRSRAEVKRMTSGAMGKVEYFFMIMAGRMCEFDDLWLRQRNVADKYYSYRLEDIAQKELGTGKNDMPYYNITPYLNGTPEQVWEVIEYCLIDAALPFQIMMKKSDIENNVEMARLVNVPMRVLIANGQQIRYQSLLLSEVHREGLFLLPYVKPPERNGKKRKEKDFEGATVLDPDIDYYVCNDLPTLKAEEKRIRRGKPALDDRPGDSRGEAEQAEQAEQSGRSKRSKYTHSHNYDLAKDMKRMEEEISDMKALRAETEKKLPPNRPVATLDFASLYPSIMQAKNLCYSTWVPRDKIESALKNGKRLERMANGEYFINPYHPIVPLDGESIDDARKRLAGDGRVLELKLEKHYLEGEPNAEEIATLAAMGRTVKKVQEETLWINFKAQEKYETRWLWEEEVWMVRHEEDVGQLPILLEKLLAARKGAKGAMGNAQNRVKILSDLLGLALLLAGDGAHKTNTEAFTLLLGKGAKDMAKKFDSFEGARDNPLIISEFLSRFIGSKETKKNWKRVLSRTVEYFDVVLKKFFDNFGGGTSIVIEDVRKALAAQPVNHNNNDNDNDNNNDNERFYNAARAVLDHHVLIYTEIGIWKSAEAANDARQMTLKVVCNSVYGATGAVVGKLPCLAISSAVTATGRQMILQCKTIAEEHDPNTHLYAHGSSPYRTKVVYGDSVTGETPCVVRNRATGMIDVRRIDELADSRAAWTQWHETKEKMDTDDWDVWTEKGWTRVQRVIRHHVPASKRIIEVTTHTGSVRVTDEHSLLRPDATPETERIDAKDVVVGQQIVHADLPRPDVEDDRVSEEEARLMGFFFADGTCGDYAYKRVPPCILNAPESVRRAFFDGYYVADEDEDQCGDVCFDVRGQIGASSMYQLLQSLGETVSINVRQDKTDIYRLTVTRNGNAQRPPHGSINAIKKIREFPHDGCTVYDLQTENHHFHAGVGRIIVHNTDSVFVMMDGCPTIKEAFQIAAKIAALCTRSFYSKYIKLELEKVFKRLLLMSKKRYSGVKVEKNKNGDEVESDYDRGTEKVRRDNAPIARKTVTRVTDIIAQTGDVGKAIECVRDVVKRMMADEIPIEEYIITKAISKDEEDYAVVQAHIELAKRKAKRMPGFTASKGDRVPFVYVKSNKKAKTIEMVEDPDFAKENNLAIHWQYYLEHGLIPPVCRFIGPLLSPPSASKKERHERAIEAIFSGLDNEFVRVKASIRDPMMARLITIDGTRGGKRKREEVEDDDEKEEYDEDDLMDMDGNEADADEGSVKVAEPPAKKKQTSINSFFAAKK